MISRIEFDDSVINMRLQNGADIFSIDSISLLIGINGSGKTNTLKNIINAINGGHNENNIINYKGCSIYNKNGVELSKNELNKWGTIYFTSLHYRSEINEKSSAFINASPKKRKSYEDYNSNKYHKILNIFNIKPKLVARIDLNYNKALQLIIDKMLTLHDEGDDAYLYNYDYSLKDIKHLYKDKKNISDLSVDIEENKFIYKNNSIIEKKIKAIRNSIAYDLFLNIMNKNNEIHVFCVFCIIESIMQKSQLSNELLMSIFDKELGIPLTSRRIIKNSSNQYDYGQDLQDLQDLLVFLNNQQECRLMLGKYDIMENINYNNSIDIDIESIPHYDSFKNSSIYNFFNIILSDMSSGQLALLEQIISISEAIHKLNKKGINKIILLIDEGDAYLHLDWQRQYVYTLNKMLSEIKKSLHIECLQLILATHSPILATDIPKDFICRLGLNRNKNTSGFAAPLYQLLNDSFDTQTIGQFSSEKINELIENIKNKKITDTDKYLIEQIDNNLVKNEIKRLLSQYNISSEF
ncbi:AAA family ATPase [Proteus hauseri]|uniref:AAA family ATPase n=1 Tax=Proteus hauseri TaxID=183417 RepID=UPI0032DA5111